MKRYSLGSALLAGAMMCTTGCADLTDDSTPAGSSSAVSAPGSGADAGASAQVSAVDVLFVIDNSGSMASEQRKLQREISRLVKMFTSGDRYAERESEVPPGLSDKARRFEPVRSLHVGVVTTNMGGSDDPPRQQAAVASCAGLGDDGILQNSTRVAVEGVTAGRLEFQSWPDQSVVVAPAPECALPALPPYQTYIAGSDPAPVAQAFACIARVGIRGCPFEQQLESMWKALAPSTGVAGDDLYSFLNGSTGQGDRANQGFLREDAVLVVVHLTDEDDCSVTDAGKALFGLSQEADALYGPLNLRCGLQADDRTLVRGTERYVRGLRALKPGHPERIVYAAVAGIPVDAITSGASYDEILAAPAMQFGEHPLLPGFPNKACVVATDELTDEAYPARRIVQVARGLGEQAVLESVCAESYGPVVNRVVEKVALQLGRP